MRQGLVIVLQRVLFGAVVQYPCSHMQKVFPAAPAPLPPPLQLELVFWLDPVFLLDSMFPLDPISRLDRMIRSNLLSILHAERL